VASASAGGERPLRARSNKSQHRDWSKSAAATSSVLRVVSGCLFLSLCQPVKPQATSIFRLAGSTRTWAMSWTNPISSILGGPISGPCPNVPLRVNSARTQTLRLAQEDKPYGSTWRGFWTPAPGGATILDTPDRNRVATWPNEIDVMSRILQRNLWLSKSRERGLGVPKVPTHHRYCHVARNLG
jgi:hypothetical protein